MIHLTRWQQRVAHAKWLVIGAFVLMTWLSSGGIAHAATPVLSIPEEDVFVLPTQNSTVQVVENIQVKNTGTASQSLRFSVPQGASAVHVARDGAKVPSAASAKAASIQIPGMRPNSTTSVVVNYELQLSAQHDVQLTLHPNYSVYSAKVYLPIGNASLSAEGLLTDTSTVTINGMKFRVFTRPGIPAQNDWTLSVQMLPSVTANPQLSMPVIGSRPDDFVNTLQAIGNLLVAAFILVIGLISIRSTQWGRAARKPLSKEEALLRSWENLELQFQDGAVSEDEYQVRRKQFKDKLLTFHGGEQV